MIGRILIVEDSVVQAAQYQIVFAKFKSQLYIKGMSENDLELVIVEDAKKALAKLCEQGGFILIITDINMPEIDGIEFLKVIKKSNLADCPKIVLSTSENITRMEEAKSQGLTTEFVIKPWKINELQELILRLVPALSF